ncbi:flavin reductase [Tropicimonas sp. TH_r6]|uniref:p-hydroxyphenylacetate 3-hydroxylase reductase component n=1 Tax=Tropicimonas sp. TH_r6 TaxID=3082085 RepID=UPI002954D910|nr:flavin reductase [Tropicimonas sp. TH_r6]MDV7143881.1 flavin reductase [Tropicimonas sp. TH_r6]
MTVMTQNTDIDPKAFRRALGNFATGVTIITTRAPDGTPVGVTASSFNSLSMDPPLILWSSMKGTPSCKVFEEAPYFAVNILGSDQMAMSNHFARQQEDKFAGHDWEEGIGGAPLFPNCAGRFQCETYGKLDGGDHWIFIGRVVAFDDFGRSPLCFHQGSYSVLFNHPDSVPKAAEGAARDVDRGRMGNHKFFMMLRAVRAYQERYLPKLDTLGLSLIEARTLLVLNDLSGLTIEELVIHLHSPVPEASAAVQTLIATGLLEKAGSGYGLTEAGQAKADKCWDLADAHAEESFKAFSDEQIETFTGVLRQLIES